MTLSLQSSTCLRSELQRWAQLFAPPDPTTMKPPPSPVVEAVMPAPPSPPMPVVVVLAAEVTAVALLLSLQEQATNQAQSAIDVIQPQRILVRFVFMAQG